MPAPKASSTDRIDLITILPDPRLERAWLHKFEGTRKAKRSIKGKIKVAGWDHAYLLHLLSIQPI